MIDGTYSVSSSSLFLVGPSGRIPPIIRQGPANQTVSRGSTVQLHCRVIGGPSVRISWEKDGERLQAKPHVTLVENGTLEIRDIKVCVIYWSGDEKDVRAAFKDKQSQRSSLPYFPVAAHVAAFCLSPLSVMNSVLYLR